MKIYGDKVKPKVKKLQSGFTLIEMLIVIAIIGILAAVAIPQYVAYKNKAYEGDAKSNLHNLYLACSAYWNDNGSNQDCDETQVTNSNYGFIQSSEVQITVSTKNQGNFSAQAYHQGGGGTVNINSSGNIS